jgi:hypothetical protein
MCSLVIITKSYRQQTYWHNDEKGDASLWVTFLEGKQADDTTLVAKDGIVSINVDDVFCIGGFRCPNVSMEQFNSYINELDTLIRADNRSYPATMIAGDFNSTGTTWGASVNDRRGIGFLDMIIKNGITPIRMMRSDFRFSRNGGTSFIYVLSVSKGLARWYVDQYWITATFCIIIRLQGRGVMPRILNQQRTLICKISFNI